MVTKTKYAVKVYNRVLSYQGQHDSFRTLNNEPLSNDDIRIVRESISLLVLLWIDVVEEYKEFPYRDVMTWVARLVRCELSTILTTFSEVEAALLRTEEMEVEAFFTPLKNNPDVQVDLVAPLRPAISNFLRFGAFRDCHLDRIRSCLCFLERLTLRSFPGRIAKGHEKYDATIAHIKSYIGVLPTENMKNFIARIFPRTEGEFLSEFVPKHGNGSVAEKSHNRSLSEKEKWKVTNTPIVSYYLRRAGIRELPLPRVATNRLSRQADVPKGIDACRVICMEPTNLMFLQQGGMRAINRLVFHRKLNKHVSLEDASYNTKLAQEGSISRLYATIDSSSASDCVRWDFVDSLFEKRPYMRRFLRAARSTDYVDPDGNVKKSLFFAPMGSALCFPIECIVFCAIVEEAAVRRGCKHPKYRVYGDDIVVQDDLAEEVCNALIEFGFKPNLKKTFMHDDPFRESCGGDYYNGFLATPLRLSRRWTGMNLLTESSDINSSVMSNVIDLANRTYSRFNLLHKYLVGRLMHETSYDLSVTTDPCDSSKLLVKEHLAPSISEFQDRRRGRGTWFQYPQKKGWCLTQHLNEWREAPGELLLWKKLSESNNSSRIGVEPVSILLDRRRPEDCADWQFQYYDLK